MKILVDAIDFLSDGEWHSFGDLSKELGLNSFKEGLLVNFLLNYNFCVACGKSLRLREDFITFFKGLGR